MNGSYLHFLRHYARIVEPPTPHTLGGVIPFSLWPNVAVTIDALINHVLIVILKSRQIGISWLVASWCLWNAMSQDGDTSLLFSKGEVEANELLGKCKRMYDCLPPFLQIKLDPCSRSELGFPSRNSSIRAFAATEAAGVSFTASRIVCDEWAYHPFAQMNYLHAKPTIDAGGQFIGVTTVDKLHPDNLAIEVYNAAPGNGFHKLFFPYHVRPGRDDAWYQRTKASIPQADLQGLTPELYMLQNYPRSEEEALRPTQTVAAVDLRVLEEMEKRCVAPIVVEGLDPLVCHVFQDYQVGQVYVAASDTSHGVGKDFNCTAIMNCRTGAVVADIFNNNMKPDDFAYYSVELLKRYRCPVWWPEDNDWGASLILKARELNYTNFGYQDEKRTKIGWHTHAQGAQSRTTLFSGLVTAFNTWGLQIFNYQGLQQFGQLIRNMEKEGRIEAKKGYSDDYPTTVAICVSKAPDALKSAEYTAEPIKTLHFHPRSRSERRRYARQRAYAH